MTTGIIGYMTPRGLGTMTHDLRVQLGIQHQLVPVDHGWGYVPEWATGNEIYLEQLHVQREDLEVWKDFFNIDTVVSIETSYGDNTFKWAKELGMRTILLPMYESFNPHMQAYQNVDLYACVSYACYQEIPYDQKRYLPWPIDTNEFKFKQRSGRAKEFVVNGGSGGLNGRKGVKESIEGFLLSNPKDLGIHLTVRTQVPLDTILQPEMMALVESDDVRPFVSIAGPTPERAQQYEEGDVLIYCSRLDGHSLVGLEGMACGMPVITTDAVPMNEFFRSRDLLVNVASRKPAGMINPHCESNIIDVNDLAKKITWCATNELEAISEQNRAIVEKDYSWDVLRSRWASSLMG